MTMLLTVTTSLNSRLDSAVSSDDRITDDNSPPSSTSPPPVHHQQQQQHQYYVTNAINNWPRLSMAEWTVTSVVMTESLTTTLYRQQQQQQYDGCRGWVGWVAVQSAASVVVRCCCCPALDMSPVMACPPMCWQHPQPPRSCTTPSAACFSRHCSLTGLYFNWKQLRCLACYSWSHPYSLSRSAKPGDKISQQPWREAEGIPVLQGIWSPPIKTKY